MKTNNVQLCNHGRNATAGAAWAMLCVLLSWTPSPCLAQGTALLEFLFDEGSGTTAVNTGSLGAGSNGGISNAMYSMDTPFGMGSSLHFDGDTDFVEVPDTFDYGNQVTVEAWIKPEAKDGQRAIYDDYGSPGVFFSIVDGRLQFNVSTDNNPGQGVSVVAGSVCLGEWQHVAGVYDGSAVHAFINGTLVGSAAVSGNLLDNSNLATHIGADSAQPFLLEYAGNMDDLRVYDVALTPDELGGGMATSGVTCVAADLRLTKTDDPDPVNVGSNLTYTLVVTNAGPGAASNVILTDTLPSSATFVSASSGCSNIGDQVICDLGSLAAGDSTNLTIVVTPTATGVITNSAVVLANQPDTSINHYATLTTTVTNVPPPGPDLMPQVDNVSITCSNGVSAGTFCDLSGDLTLKHNGVPFAMATFDFDAVCKKCPAQVKWKLSGLLTLTFLDLTGIPDHDIALYLSDDATFDPAVDTLLVKKPIGLLALLKAFGGGKPLKLKAKVPAGVDLSGKFLIVVEDDGDLVDESDETNNFAAFGPL